MKYYLKLIRIENLLMIALSQIVIKYTFLNQAEILQALNNWKYFLLIIATLSIAAAGYIINDIYDVDVDAINKPNKVYVGSHISEKNAYNLYFALNVIGVGLGFYLSRTVGKPAIAAVFVICSALLYVYSNGLKQLPIVGNVVIAFLAASSILVVGLFNIFPFIFEFNSNEMFNILSVIIDYAVLAFLLHFAREVVKTIEDIEGDKAFEITTVASYFGIPVSKILTSFTLLGFIGYACYFIYNNIMHMPYVIGYFVILMMLPTLFVIFKTITAKSKADFSFISKLLKIIMLTTIFSLTAIVLIGN
ncbi:geranylgeranylglycerol-phosphate geranylgeranyltransferase [Flavobacterium difficile]|uniref:UbiA family prenyltransferase n=1 Tax=Flavobacterium difficile TaxID=2709659 RepID=A0ABX0I766_9FLAO|nr:geranylgeranylglycerol-phosphate geranylgeranyltransferase [Flavobacterium difficile]NHM02023.1 UbiA family prenyltransferase [Flavobacterium difficile]